MNSGKKIPMAVALVAVFLFLMPTVAAQEEDLPPWSFGISVTASMMAISTSAVAVAELAVYPKTFW